MFEYTTRHGPMGLEVEFPNLVGEHAWLLRSYLRSYNRPSPLALWYLDDAIRVLRESVEAGEYRTVHHNDLILDADGREAGVRYERIENGVKRFALPAGTLLRLLVEWRAAVVAAEPAG